MSERSHLPSVLSPYSALSTSSALRIAVGVVALTVLGFCAPPAGAEAQTQGVLESDGRQWFPSAHGALSWDGTLGGGAGLSYHFVSSGVVYGARDELAVNLELNCYFAGSGGETLTALWPDASLQWNLFFDNGWSFYPELGLTGQFEVGRRESRGLLPNVGFGLRYHFARYIAAHGRLGWPHAISLGLSF